MNLLCNELQYLIYDNLSVKSLYNLSKCDKQNNTLIKEVFKNKNMTKTNYFTKLNVFNILKMRIMIKKKKKKINGIYRNRENVPILLF